MHRKQDLKFEVPGAAVRLKCDTTAGKVRCLSRGHLFLFLSRHSAGYIRALPSQDLIQVSSVKLAYPECFHLQDAEWTMEFQGGNFAQLRAGEFHRRTALP